MSGRWNRFARGAGVISGILGALSVLAELCFRFPHDLVYNDARTFYAAHIDFFRGVLLVSILVTFVLGCVSVIVLRSVSHGVLGLLLGTVAILLGGPNAEALTTSPHRVSAGLDYFILSLLVLALLFVPLEMLWPLHKQRVFRKGWQTDLTYFFTNHIGIQLLVFLSMVPLQLFFAWAVHGPLQRTIAAQPLWLQLIEILFAVDLSSYWTHRAFHHVPLLWRIHSIHHSTEQMDWLAGSRMHVLDVIVNRMMGFLPVFLLGFSPAAVYGYLVFLSFHSVYIHANVRHRWPVLRKLLATPEFHHWHHAADVNAMDKNFSVLLPCIDFLFGTAYLPGEWPARYGVLEGGPPVGYLGQLTFPFRRVSE